jgi:hypothetical protein
VSCNVPMLSSDNVQLTGSVPMLSSDSV